MVMKLIPEPETFFEKGGKNIYKAELKLFLYEAKAICVVKEASFILKLFWKWFGIWIFKSKTS